LNKLNKLQWNAYKWIKNEFQNFSFLKESETERSDKREKRFSKQRKIIPRKGNRKRVKFGLKSE